MSEIIFPSSNSDPFYSDVIEFPAIVDGKTIKCRITLEEVIREFQRGTTPKTFAEHFKMLRPEIEERAKRLIRDKGAQESGPLPCSLVPGLGGRLTPLVRGGIEG